MPNIVIGRPARGDDFFDREKEQRQIWTRLNDGNNLLLLAPRRVGKTSLLYRLRQSAWGEGWLAAYASVADARNEGEFLERLIRGISIEKESARALAPLRQGRWKKLFGHFRSAFDEVSLGELGVKLRELPPQEWSAVARDLKQALPAVRRRWLIMLDEVPVFVMTLLRADPSGARARDFLTAFREIRQGTAEQEEDPIQWILAGSIGLDNLARRYSMVGTINDCAPFELGAFTPEVADEFLRALAIAVQLDLGPEVRAHLRERAEWLIPHHLQILVASLRDRCEETDSQPNVELVDAAFEAVLGHAYRSYFDHWSVRLGEELGSPDDAYAKRVLTVAARVRAGATASVLSQALAAEIADPDRRAEVLPWLLDVLARDGYLIEIEGRWRFRSPLLREYWARRFDA